MRGSRNIIHFTCLMSVFFFLFFFFLFSLLFGEKKRVQVGCKEVFYVWGLLLCQTIRKLYSMGKSTISILLMC